MPKPYSAQTRVTVPTYGTLRKRLKYRHWTGQIFDTKFKWPHVNFGLRQMAKPGGFALKHHVCPFYYELGPAPWYIDFNEHLGRKQHEHPLLVFDALHILLLRRPPPGPFFFLPDGEMGYQFAEIINTLRQRVYPAKYYSEFRLPQMCPIDQVGWFNPNHPYIKWRPSRSRWSLYYRDPRSGKQVSSSFGPWSYWKAIKRLQCFLLDDCHYDTEDLPIDLANAASGFNVFQPKGPDEAHRFFTSVFGDRQPGPEHPRDPYWFYAWNQRKAALSLAHLRDRDGNLPKGFDEPDQPDLTPDPASVPALSRYLLGS